MNRVLPQHVLQPDTAAERLSDGVVVLLLVLAVVPATAFCLSAVSLELRTPPDLRGNWWTAFERDFRAYERAAARPPQR